MFVFTATCFSTIVHLRKGGAITGEVVSKDDEKLVIKTAEGEKTLKWREVKNKSIKEIYPELYETLKAQAIERKSKKEEKKNKENKNDFSRVRLKVETNESVGAYKKVNFDFDLDKFSSKKKRMYKAVKFYKKDGYGKINIKISGLDQKKKYTLKTVYSHYIKVDGDAGSFIKKTPSDKNIVRGYF